MSRLRPIVKRRNLATKGSKINKSLVDLINIPNMTKFLDLVTSDHPDGQKVADLLETDQELKRQVVSNPSSIHEFVTRNIDKSRLISYDEMAAGKPTFLNDVTRKRFADFNKFPSLSNLLDQSGLSELRLDRIPDKIWEDWLDKARVNEAGIQ